MGLYLAEWLGVMREGASQIQLLPCGLVSSCTAPHAAGLVAEGEGRMLLASAAGDLPLSARVYFLLREAQSVSLSAESFTWEAVKIT